MKTGKIRHIPLIALDQPPDSWLAEKLPRTRPISSNASIIPPVGSMCDAWRGILHLPTTVFNPTSQVPQRKFEIVSNFDDLVKSQ